MADPRTPRDLSARDKTMRTVYKPPSSLPDPSPEPGYVYRWIATHIMGDSQPNNVSRQMRDGWVPVKATDHPELQLMGNVSGNVEVGGLMLCKMPKERAEARDDYYRQMAHTQMESVDNHFMRNNDPRMPMFSDKQTETTRGTRFGSGR